jgi:protein O-GlcNAc transferase
MHLQALLEQINGGHAAEALPELDALLRRQPGHPGALALRAEALRLTGHVPEAIRAFKHAGERGAGVRNWLAAGILLAAERSIDEASECLHRALEETPDSDEVLDALITTLFNANRAAEGIEFARRQLTLSANPTFLSRAALLLQGNDLYEESSNAFKRILQLAPEDPGLVGAALVPARFTCDWDWVDTLLRKIRTYHDEGRFGAAQEYPLTHVAWCADEARNLEVTRAYVARMVPRADSHIARAPRSAGSRLRVGYLSCDFRNHATMHLMAGVFENHDRARFEIFAYDYSSPDVSTYRQRFLDAVEHHVPLHSLSDRQAAVRIGEDGLDILFDLKLYTGGGRAGILAYRPATLQAAYLGFPGSAASTDIDYVVSDRFVTPDDSAPYYSEKFCRLPHTYQCNDRKRSGAPEPGTRATHGLPDDKVVFGAFNQSYKVDRASFSHWLRVLKEVPNSVLWLLGQSEAAIANLSRYAQAAGIGRERLIFAPFCQPQEHLARLALADAVLDTLIYNGHTTTSDALWAGVPVITARGRHFASRVSESLLNAMELPELVGADPDEMVRIAKRIGSDAKYRRALRAKVAANRLTTPLFDTQRFTRNFEHAIELMTEAQRSGLPPTHIDVPDCGPVQPGDGTPAAPASLAVARPAATAATVNAAPAPAAPLQAAYPACPLCAGPSVSLGFANCSVHPLWHEPLPPAMEWMQCPSCGHIHSRHYWTDDGLKEIARKTSPDPRAHLPAVLVSTRATWTPVVDRVVGLLGGYRAAFNRPSAPVWVDVGCGDGALVMTAADYGFAAVGVDLDADAVPRIQSLGFNAVRQDFMKLSFEIEPAILSMLDVLPQIPRPLEALRKAAQVLHPGGLLVISTPDFASSSWRALEAAKVNPYWTELEHYHFFSRERLIGLLEKCGFEVADLWIPNHGKAQMQLCAIRI